MSQFLLGWVLTKYSARRPGGVALRCMAGTPLCSCCGAADEERPRHEAVPRGGTAFPREGSPHPIIPRDNALGEKDLRLDGGR